MTVNSKICLFGTVSEISINGVKLLDQQNQAMVFEEGSTCIAVLTTTGRISGRNHSKMLKAVIHNGKVYFSRHKPDSDWFKNIMKNPAVMVHIGEQKFQGNASIVTDEGLSQKISELKYPGEMRAKERRVAVQVSLCGLL